MADRRTRVDDGVEGSLVHMARRMPVRLLTINVGPTPPPGSGGGQVNTAIEGTVR